MAEEGSSVADGSCGPGYRSTEVPARSHVTAGLVMPDAAPNTNGSQPSITYTAQYGLYGKDRHLAFNQLIEVLMCYTAVHTSDYLVDCRRLADYRPCR